MAVAALAFFGERLSYQSIAFAFTYGSMQVKKTQTLSKVKQMSGLKGVEVKTAHRL
jgi:hypothetical protein